MLGLFVDNKARPPTMSYAKCNAIDPAYSPTRRAGGAALRLLLLHKLIMIAAVGNISMRLEAYRTIVMNGWMGLKRRES